MSFRDDQSRLSPVKTRDAAERVDILLNRATSFFSEGQYDRAEEALHAALAIMEQQEVVSILDHLRAFILVGRLYSALGNPIAALTTHKKVAEQIFDHAGSLDIDDPKTAALLKLHEYTLVEARQDVETQELERLAS